jgi:16S rRNA C967 or C1407 C5-methylase (RsmB/RsmF family)/NOL1/NOP2/fmu family ribosome biogenesis protein
VNSFRLPDAFTQRMKETLGPSYSDFLDSFQKAAPVSVRLNPFKKTNLFQDLDPVPWSSDSYYLPQRISFTLDPLFHAGCYYVQEASSMFLEQIFLSVNTGSPVKVLDMCAAPGGKSTHLLSLLPAGSLLVSNELLASRNKILQHNLTKWGCENVIITQNDAADFSLLENYFDIIVVDAPCSGEGLFRKDPAAMNEWSTEAVELCSIRQKDILQKLIPSLKENGILIYSTCTYEEKENDEVCENLIQSGTFECVALKEFSGLTKTKYGFQFYPHQIKGEGFYIAALRKTAGGGSIKKNIKDFAFSKKRADKFLERPAEYTYYEKNNELYAVPQFMKNDFATFINNFFVRQAGIHMGSILKDEIIPSYKLSLSNSQSLSLPSIEVDLDNALKYLRCEPIKVPAVSNGWYVVKYQNRSLGWIKQVSGRFNNYFPREHRILMR